MQANDYTSQKERNHLVLDLRNFRRNETYNLISFVHIFAAIKKHFDRAVLSIDDSLVKSTS